MVDPKDFIEALEAGGIDFFCGVPDSLLKNFCAYLTDHRKGRHVITANEGGAVALASGHFLATGNPSLVYMQNSGQGNAVNPLLSLADPDVYSIPMVLLVGWRGEPGVHDEPQHLKQGKVTCSLFETMGIPSYVLSAASAFEWRNAVAGALAQAKDLSAPVALVVEKGFFGDYSLQDKNADIAPLRREEAIEAVLRALPPEAVVVSTTGMISREVYETRIRLGQDHSHDFLTVGSMGHASQIALGIAMAQPKQLVFCLDGDGASIMQMGNMAITGQSSCANLYHIVLNNAAHDSVGGQPTIGGLLDFESLAAGFGYEVLHAAQLRNPASALSPAVVEESLRAALSEAGAAGNSGGKSAPRPKFLEIKVAKGARKDLGRPKESPQVNRDLFMRTLGSAR